MPLLGFPMFCLSSSIVLNGYFHILVNSMAIFWSELKLPKIAWPSPFKLYQFNYKKTSNFHKFSPKMPNMSQNMLEMSRILYFPSYCPEDFVTQQGNWNIQSVSGRPTYVKDWMQLRMLPILQFFFSVANLTCFSTHCEEIYNFMLIPSASAGLQILQNLQTFLGRPDPGVDIEWCTYYLKKPCFSLPFTTLFTFAMNIYLQNTGLLFYQIKISETLLNWKIKALTIAF